MRVEDLVVGDKILLDSPSYIHQVNGKIFTVTRHDGGYCRIYSPEAKCNGTMDGTWALYSGDPFKLYHKSQPWKWEE